MNGIKKWIIFLSVLLIVGVGLVFSAFAFQDGRKGKNRHHNRDGIRSAYNADCSLEVVNNAEYLDNCGACHFAYQPGLLPSGSWTKILNSRQDHFGEDIDIDPESIKSIEAYLNANAADRSSSKLSARIMKSLGTQTPTRITDIPFIQRKHGRGCKKAGVKSIEPASNCAACHTTAEKGLYDDDYVSIPK